jgi:hypothetical protein
MEEIIRACDWIRLGQQVARQLDVAHAKLGEAERTAERSWLDEARALLAQGSDERDELLERARALPELAILRQEHAADLIPPWADALEHLHAGIVFNAGVRTPLLEALFPHKKFDVLRRAKLDQAQAYGADFQRRLSTSYVARLLGSEFAFAQALADEVTKRFAMLAPAPAREANERDEISERLGIAAHEMETVIRQAALLCEAALVRLPGAFDELGLRTKPKARTAAKAKSGAAEAPPEVEKAPAKAAKKAPAKAPKKAPAKAAKNARPKPEKKPAEKKPKGKAAPEASAN